MLDFQSLANAAVTKIRRPFLAISICLSKGEIRRKKAKEAKKENGEEHTESEHAHTRQSRLGLLVISGHLLKNEYFRKVSKISIDWFAFQNL